MDSGARDPAPSAITAPIFQRQAVRNISSAYTLLKPSVNDTPDCLQPVTLCAAAVSARESIFASLAPVAFSLSQAERASRRQFLCGSVP